MNTILPTMPPDKELWSSDPQVKQEALHRLCVVMKDVMYGLARHILHNNADAEDVVQDAFQRFMESLDRLPPDTEVRPYLMQTVRHRCLDLLRKKHPQVCESPELAKGKIVFGGATRHPDVEVMVLELLGQLSSEDRTAVTLRWIHELPPAECAIVMEMPLNNFKVRLHRAMAKLMDLVDQKNKECSE